MIKLEGISISYTESSVDAFLPGAGKNLAKNAFIRGTSEGGQEVAESAFVLNSVNKVLDTNLDIMQDAGGNFVTTSSCHPNRPSHHHPA